MVAKFSNEWWFLLLLFLINLRENNEVVVRLKRTKNDDCQYQITFMLSFYKLF